MTKATKRSVNIIIGIAVVILAGLFVALYSGIRFRNPFIFLPESGQSIVTSREPVFDHGTNYSYTSLREVAGAGVIDSLSYEGALSVYAGKVIQFDPNCRANPVTMVLPPKSVVMLGNQSKWRRTIIVGPRTYTIDPYDYILASFNMPGQFGISCDSVQDVGIISIQ